VERSSGTGGYVLDGQRVARLKEQPEPNRYADSLTEDGRYRLLVEAVRDYAICMLDPMGILTSWNRGAARFKGYDASEIIGRHFSVFYTEEDKRTNLPQRALETAAREGICEHQGWRVRKDGTRFWAHVVIEPIRSDSGELVGFAKITRDLTEQKKAADALRRSEEQFRLLVQGVTDYAIYMLDPEGRITNWNAGAERLKGYKPRGNCRPKFCCLLSQGRSRTGYPKSQSADRRTGRPIRERGMAITKGWYAVLGERRHRSHSR
jgi:PAS domain S-box-containing protein